MKKKLATWQLHGIEETTYMEKINYKTLLARYVRFVESELSNEGLTYMNILNEGPFSEPEIKVIREMLN